ncbi:PR domain zinc finger protein 12-like [Mizuhopecten yessoensis]|uniref:PR domain zinc finger protein 12-like n=1 Tax=Mizuhopecten yessoensis TaxID=6573 RepID=UPI000B45E6F0|nr:PR domain zinc finger protein 12-like [Mizuhopecten yessoensis]
MIAYITLEKVNIPRSISYIFVEITDPTYLPLPHQVVIARSTLPGAGHGVFATSKIKPGTEMGPYVGTILHHGDLNSDTDNTKTWEVFDKDGRVLYFLDGGTRNPASWLTFVQCARSELEQNLEVVQAGMDIYYRALRDIEPEEELLVWYGRSQNLYMGIPDPDLDDPSGIQGNNKAERRCEVEEVDATTGKLRCVLCRRGFNSRSNLRSHMRIHTLEKPFTCRFCNRRFSQSSTLRNHVRLHTGEKPYRCQICTNSYSQLAGLRAHQRSARHRPSAS